MALALAGCLNAPPSGLPTPGDDAGAEGRLVAISYDMGGQIADALYEHADGQQGTILLWLELGPDLGALEGPVDLAHLSGFTIELDPGTRMVVARLDGMAEDGEMTAAIGDWAAGTTHLLSLRWDATSVLGDLQHASLRVDEGDAVYGVGDRFEPAVTPEEPQVIDGGAVAEDGPVIVRSAFVLRRPIRDDDPPSGVYVGIDDEHEAIFSAGVAGDPTLVFGSWDVVFALSPHGDPVVAEPFRGWSHPLGDNLLGAGGYMLSRDLAADRWTLVDESGTLGGDPAVASAATGTFNGGYRVENGSLSRTLTSGVDVHPGDRLLLRVIAYVGASGTGASAMACLGAAGDPCASTAIGRLSSSRLLPDILLVGYEVGAEDVEVRLSMTDTDGSATRPIVVFAQAELQPNLLVDPGFEREPTTLPPDGWSASAGLEVGEMQQSGGNAHSGSYGLVISSSSPADEVPDAIMQEPDGMEDLAFYLVGGYFRRAADDPAGITATDGSLFRQDSDFADDGKLAVPDPGNAGVWHHRFAVGKRLAGEGRSDAIRWGGSDPFELTATALDDAYVVRLSPVELSLNRVAP